MAQGTTGYNMMGYNSLVGLSQQNHHQNGGHDLEVDFGHNMNSDQFEENEEKYVDDHEEPFFEENLHSQQRCHSLGLGYPTTMGDQEEFGICMLFEASETDSYDDLRRKLLLANTAAARYENELMEVKRRAAAAEHVAILKDQENDELLSDMQEILAAYNQSQTEIKKLTKKGRQYKVERNAAIEKIQRQQMIHLSQEKDTKDRLREMEESLLEKEDLQQQLDEQVIVNSELSKQIEELKEERDEIRKSFAESQSREKDASKFFESLAQMKANMRQKLEEAHANKMRQLEDELTSCHAAIDRLQLASHLYEKNIRDLKQKLRYCRCDVPHSESRERGRRVPHAPRRKSISDDNHINHRETSLPNTESEDEDLNVSIDEDLSDAGSIESKGNDESSNTDNEKDDSTTSNKGKKSLLLSPKVDRKIKRASSGGEMPTSGANGRSVGRRKSSDVNFSSAEERPDTKSKDKLRCQSDQKEATFSDKKRTSATTKGSIKTDQQSPRKAAERRSSLKETSENKSDQRDVKSSNEKVSSTSDESKIIVKNTADKDLSVPPKYPSDKIQIVSDNSSKMSSSGSISTSNSSPTQGLEKMAVSRNMTSAENDNDNDDRSQKSKQNIVSKVQRLVERRNKMDTKSHIDALAASSSPLAKNREDLAFGSTRANFSTITTNTKSKDETGKLQLTLYNPMAKRKSIGEYSETSSIQSKGTINEKSKKGLSKIKVTLPVPDSVIPQNVKRSEWGSKVFGSTSK